MTRRRFRFLETTIFIDLILVTRIRDDRRPEVTTTQPIRIPALLAWLLVQLWTWPGRWARVKGWTGGPVARLGLAWKVGQVWSLAWLYGMGVNL